MTDALEASHAQLQKVTFEDFRRFCQAQNASKYQIVDTWRRLCSRLPFIRKEFGIELVCLDCDRIMPCMCDEPERLPEYYRQYVLTRRCLVGLPEHALVTMGGHTARMVAFVRHLRES